MLFFFLGGGIMSDFNVLFILFFGIFNIFCSDYIKPVNRIKCYFKKSFKN